MSKKITKYDFSKDVKEFYKKEIKEFVGKNGKTYSFLFTNKLSEKQKQAILQDYILYDKEITENSDSYDKEIIYTLILIKHLTDLYLYDESDKENALKHKYIEGNDTTLDMIRKELDIFDFATELGLIKPIIENLNSEAIKEMNEYLINFTSVSNTILEEYKKEINKAE